MNAAVRAIVRCGLHNRAEVFAIREGWQGAVDGGDQIRPLGWGDVSNILSRGGTVIGTARCAEFRTEEGQKLACRNLIQRGIDRLIVVGGDGSLTGTRLLRLAWPRFVAELLAEGEITPDQAAAHPTLIVAGLVGSIDNDMVGTDMTIGTDSAMHRITDAIDALTSTAASHQRTFIVEVMGRNCGYLALMSAVAGGADFVLIPESPPTDGWEQRMCDALRRGRSAGRRESIVIVAEGAADRAGARISADRVHDAIAAGLGEDARITILGHVQRGGTPSAYDRWMATSVGVAAVEHVLSASADTEPTLFGVRANEVSHEPLLESVDKTHAVADDIAAGRYERAVAARGAGFEEMIDIYRRITEAHPSVEVSEASRRVAVMHAGALAPGMNQIVRDATRLGIDLGYQMVGIHGGFPGLAEGRFTALEWADVEGLASAGGADLGTRRYIPSTEELYGLSRQLEEHRIDALLLSGGFHAYAGAMLMARERNRYPGFDIPVALLPASIDNNLPGWHMSVGCDTALNTIVNSIDMLRQAAAASKRAFVVETMGRECGFLAFMGGLAGGAERIYLPEEPLSLEQLSDDVSACVQAFSDGRVFYLAVRGEGTSEYYTTDVIANLLEAEGRGSYSVRQAVLGHVQQGGSPTPFDRITSARLTYRGVSWLDKQLREGTREYSYASNDDGRPAMRRLTALDDQMDWQAQRPVDQWWLRMRPILDQLSRRPGQI